MSTPAKKRFILSLLGVMASLTLFSQTEKIAFQTSSPYILNSFSEKAFPLVVEGHVASIYVDPQEWKGVIRAAKDLGDDIRKVSGKAAEVIENTEIKAGSVLVGTIGKSRIIDRLIEEGKIDISEIEGQWESFLIQTVGDQLVVAGSDKRGTIYGIYDISEKIGVSPWYFWADVPPRKSNTLYVQAGRYLQESPKVKYRGIFINDEEPSFGGWSKAQFGGVNAKMYVHMFELLLRLKANYLWPAMWGKAFNEDDPMNPVLADEYGIVMGTSHHEPMMRAHQEYTKRRKEVGPWDYAANKERLDQFFLEGLERNKNYDNMITIGMRGDGDVAMGDGSDEENMKTLQKVIEGQRQIIQKVYEKDPEEVPQLWAIFTEVQRYYDAGFTVPDDVMLLLCDNNWGYIRRIAPPKERERKGGLGLYYHIDMNGGPWNDRWVNTTTIPKLREQFHLAYQTGIDKLWVVNVGDLKPKELPIDFIMRYAWNLDAIPADKTWAYTVDWATRLFGETYAEEIADIVSKYNKYNLWRKPEAQATSIFSVVNHREADRVIELWRDVASRAEALAPRIAPEMQDAYYQLVLYPAKASAGVGEMYLASAKNNLYAAQGRISANDYAARARALFEVDNQLSSYYNDQLSGGKWKNMMSDIHIGYVNWFMPEKNVLPELIEVVPINRPHMGIAVEGSALAWPGATEQAELPLFDILKNQRYYIDIFNRGTGSFEFSAKTKQPWIKLNKQKGHVEKEERLHVWVDWDLLLDGTSEGFIEIKQGKNKTSVKVQAVKQPLPRVSGHYFGNLTGEFSIPANKYNANIAGKNARWIELPDLGRAEACMGISPVTASSATIEDAPTLEYTVFFPEAGNAIVCLGILPTQDVYPERGLRIAVALDNETPQTIDARKGLIDTFGEYTPQNLSMSKVLQPLPKPNKEIAFIGTGQHRRNEVFDNLRWLDAEVEVKTPGIHTLKIYMVDPEIVLENIIVNPDNKYPSYFGIPPLLHNASESK
ncbi:hypothetical protein M2480_001721 [Parabacteroides sp. PFB2-12]|uniref:glycosyl hydrolase 115 family protein n=1 Tax=Parabacteroides sp. PFB2-12 TaxID=2940652 RepID=UPI002475EF8E|nr:glycosyl hydrolase 115 family protein [Parabacteroides sp. PFB2-12]MDH6390739.1 hypothetical protein [Parabacteroides sp. PFB2-12]